MIDSFQVFVVSCDECATQVVDATGEQMEFTNKPLAISHLFEHGWKIETERTLCPTCTKELEEKAYVIIHPVIGSVHFRVNARNEDEAMELFKQETEGLEIAHNIGADEPLEFSLNLVEDISKGYPSLDIQKVIIRELSR